MTALKTIFFMLLVPGLLLGVLPAWLMATDTALFSFGLFRWLAVPLWLIGAAVMLWCAWDFTGEERPARLYRYRADAVAEVKARRLFL